MNYPKAFEGYWAKAYIDIGNIEIWQIARLKAIAYRAWRRGRMYQASLEQNHG